MDILGVIAASMSLRKVYFILIKTQALWSWGLILASQQVLAEGEGSRPAANSFFCRVNDH